MDTNKTVSSSININIIDSENDVRTNQSIKNTNINNNESNSGIIPEYTKNSISSSKSDHLNPQETFNIDISLQKSKSQDIPIPFDVESSRTASVDPTSRYVDIDKVIVPFGYPKPKSFWRYYDFAVVGFTNEEIKIYLFSQTIYIFMNLLFLFTCLDIAYSIVLLITSLEYISLFIVWILFFIMTLLVLCTLNTTIFIDYRKTLLLIQKANFNLIKYKLASENTSTLYNICWWFCACFVGSFCTLFNQCYSDCTSK
ncbi:hypothetical protein WA158_004410 [Blastocystis sp. Blastoise]